MSCLDTVRREDWPERTQTWGYPGTCWRGWRRRRWQTARRIYDSANCNRTSGIQWRVVYVTHITYVTQGAHVSTLNKRHQNHLLKRHTSRIRHTSYDIHTQSTYQRCHITYVYCTL